MFDLSISRDGTPKYPKFFSVKSVLITLYESTAMGLPKSFQSKSKIIRIIWFFLFLGAFSVTFYYVSYNLDVYNQNNVNSIIENSKENLLMKFPAVSICLISSDRNFSYNYNISDILEYCQFGTSECNETNFIQYFDLNYGKCFTFNNSVKSQIDLRVSNGLKLVMNTNMTLINGFQIGIHNETEFPNSSQFISAASNGFVTNIGISKQTETKPGLPYNQCENDYSTVNKSFIIDYFLEKNLTYRQNDCFYFAFLQYFGLKCSIQGRFLDIIQNYNYEKMKNCYQEALKQFSIENLNKSTCPLECSTSTFVPSVTYYYNKSMDNESLSEINVYYNNYPFVLISQTPQFLITDLVANVGGTSGLFLGASLITPFELIEIIYKLMGTLVIKIYNKII